MSYQITLTAALDVSHTNCARLVTDAQRQRPDKKGGPDVAIMIAIRSWRDVTIIDHSNAPMSTALNRTTDYPGADSHPLCSLCRLH